MSGQIRILCVDDHPWMENNRRGQHKKDPDLRSMTIAHPAHNEFNSAGEEAIFLETHPASTSLSYHDSSKETPVGTKPARREKNRWPLHSLIDLTP